MSETKVKDFEYAKWEIECNGMSYIMELDNASIKRADELGVVQTITKGESGIQLTLERLIYVFGIKNHNMTPNLAKKLARSIIEEQEYDLQDVVSEMIEELAVRYEQVFTPQGAKKSLKKM